MSDFRASPYTRVRGFSTLFTRQSSSSPPSSAWQKRSVQTCSLCQSPTNKKHFTRGNGRKSFGKDEPWGGSSPSETSRKSRFRQTDQETSNHEDWEDGFLCRTHRLTV